MAGLAQAAVASSALASSPSSVRAEAAVTSNAVSSRNDAVFDIAYAAPRTTDPQISTPLMTYSRWKKSEGTFGPAGRVVATVLLLLPLTLSVAAIATGIGIIGAGIYIFVIMPWALRDIWKKAATAVQPPHRTDARARF